MHDIVHDDENMYGSDTHVGENRENVIVFARWSSITYNR